MPILPIDNKKRLFVRVVAWAAVVSLPILHWADDVSGSWTPERLTIVLAGMAAALAALTLVDLGRLRIGAGILAFGLVPWLAWVNVAGGGVAVPGTAAYMIFVVLAGWIFGWRAMLA